MLEVNKPEKLLDEIEQARALNKSVTDVSKSILRVLLGNTYSLDEEHQNEQPVPENHPFEYHAAVLPKIAFNNPMIRAEPDGVPGAEPQIRGLQHAVNRWSRQTKQRSVLGRLASDFLVGFGVSHMTMRPVPGAGGISGQTMLRPVNRRLSPRLFFIDHKATDPDEARHKGHALVRDKQDLVRLAASRAGDGWDADAVEALLKDANLEVVYDDKIKLREPARGEVTLYEVWVPEVTLRGFEGDPEFNGTIYTLATAKSRTTDKAGKPMFVRAPRPFFGPTWGPYTLYGAYWVGDNVYPLSALSAVFEQVKELNAHATSAARSAANYKKGIGYDAMKPEAGKALNTFTHGGVFPIPDLAGGVAQQFEVGGVPRESYEYLQVLQDRLFRRSGLDEAQRGQVNAGATATAVAEAAAASNQRIDYMAKQFTEQVTTMMRSSAWYMWHSHFFKSRVGVDGIESFQGGALPGDIPFEDVDINIVARSIGHTNDAILQRRAENRLALLTGVAQVIPQTPYMRWADILEDYGQETNDQNIGSYVDLDAAARFFDQQISGGGETDKTIPPPLRVSPLTEGFTLLGNQKGAQRSESNRVTQ